MRLPPFKAACCGILDFKFGENLSRQTLCTSRLELIIQRWRRLGTIHPHSYLITGARNCFAHVATWTNQAGYDSLALGTIMN
jgi:hypothetical protein